MDPFEYFGATFFGDGKSTLRDHKTQYCEHFIEKHTYDNNDIRLVILCIFQYLFVIWMWSLNNPSKNIMLQWKKNLYVYIIIKDNLETKTKRNKIAHLVSWGILLNSNYLLYNCVF